MNTQIWIIGQIAIDIVMVLLLLWFLRFQGKRQLSWQDHETVIRRSEVILNEMKEISRSLEKNLEEKKVLSRQILDQLEQGLKQAEESYQRIADIIPRSCGTLPQSSASAKDNHQTMSSIQALLEKGLSKGEIARHLGMSVGEIELLIKLTAPKKG